MDFQPKYPVGPVGPAGAGVPGPKGDPGTPGTNGTNGTNGTTPAAGTAAQLTAGTDTVQRSWSAKDIADFVTAKIGA